MADELLRGGSRQASVYTYGFFILIIIVVFSFIAFKGKNDNVEELGERSERPAEEQETLYVSFSDTLNKGESIYLSLKRGGVSDRATLELTNSLQSVMNLKRSLLGDSYFVNLDSTGAIERFEYTPGIEETIIAERLEGKLISRKEHMPLDRSIRATGGMIEDNLYSAIVDLEGRKAGILVERLAEEIFGWDIDFSSDPRPGDRFGMVFEEYFRDGQFIRYGIILSAEYRSRKKIHRAVYYEDPQGNRGYYNPDGSAKRKMFLKLPLEYFKRVSSGYTHRRFHPILKRYLPHFGIDYAASVGTPIRATADGVISYKGWKGPNGRLIKIKHKRGYESSYGHIYRYHKGIKKGKKVKQGQVIGYVGSSGRSTGPHLDYRLKKNGEFINPQKENILTADPVGKEYVSNFLAVKDEMIGKLDEVWEEKEQIAQVAQKDSTDEALAIQKDGKPSLFRIIYNLF